MTAGCDKCRGFCETVKISRPSQYRDLLRQLRQIIAEGTMRLVRGTCDLDAIPTDGDEPWPSDTITHKFACTHCDREFELFVDTYHGGGSWGPS